jgi:hypothetical protein
MNIYTLTVTVQVEHDHLFPAIMRVQDALNGFTYVNVDYDHDDPIAAQDFEGAKRLLAPVCDRTHWSEDTFGNETRIDCGNGCEY